MNRLRKTRLIIVSMVIMGVGTAIGLALFALRQNINLFYTPSQVYRGKVPHDHEFRLGGIVVPGTVQHAKQGVTVDFVLTDTAHKVKVFYNGILPDLFRQGQGIVAQGRLNSKGDFIADQVLAKHDKNYMPPEVASAIKEAKQQRGAM